MLLVDLTDEVKTFEVIGVGAVRKIEPKNIDPGPRQRQQLFLTFRGGANGGDDFGFLLGHFFS